MKNKLYSIPASQPFADRLARWILDAHSEDLLALSRVLLFLPSRRACLSMREAFLRASDGKPLLLPRIQPLGDISEDMLLAAPIAPTVAVAPPSSAFQFKRLFILARLINRYREQTTGHSESLDHALKLAQELARLLDELEREQLSLDGISALVPDMFAAHWQITVEFLKILSSHWPQISKEEGLISPEIYRNQTLHALGDYWIKSPPDYPVIAAGTTGSIPATAQLLKVIATLPKSAIVLPGFDTHLSKEDSAHLSENHPQWGMRQLLATLDCDSNEVQIIGEEANRGRVQLLSEIMRPAETSDAWQHLNMDMPAAIQGMTEVCCSTLQEEATVIALMMRETVRVPGKTAALITHDRSLARRVAATMRRFDVTVDDSAGKPLSHTPIASFLRLVLDVIVSDMAAVPLLSLLKHPLAHLGMDRINCLQAARILEIECFRNDGHHITVRQLAASAANIKTLPQDVQLLMARIMQCFAPLSMLFKNNEKVALESLVEAHLQTSELLAGETLWTGPEADSLAGFFAELTEASVLSGSVTPDHYPAVFEVLLAGRVMRMDYGAHPRLKILSPTEARMQSFDRIILGGLNEGSWPPETLTDPWFNRSMRKALGLSDPERQTGLAAHDFYMLASHNEVYLTRCEKREGSPTTASRWLVKLNVLVRKYSNTCSLKSDQWNRWAAALDAASETVPVTPPAPLPPIAARPRQLSVTDIETLMRNPYAIYASKILRLYPLDALEKELGGADFGNAIHRALEEFVKAYPVSLPENAHEMLLQYGRKALEPLFFNVAVESLWWPRFTRIASFIIEQEIIHRPSLTRVISEMKGLYRLGNFTLSGRADRIEEHRDGSLTIIDYKTGVLPLMKDIEDGFASQLILLALIVSEGEAPVHGPVAGLEYWRLQGGEEAGKVKPIDDTKIEAYIDAAKEGLKRLIEKYNNPDFPYLSTPVSARASRYNDYVHLARIKEWS